MQPSACRAHNNLHTRSEQHAPRENTKTHGKTQNPKHEKHSQTSEESNVGGGPCDGADCTYAALTVAVAPSHKTRAQRRKTSSMPCGTSGFQTITQTGETQNYMIKLCCCQSFNHTAHAYTVQKPLRWCAAPETVRNGKWFCE